MKTNLKNQLGLLASEIKFVFLSGISRLINLFPHPENVIIFESNSDFSDNPRALFDYMISIGLNKKYRMVWIVKNMEAIEKYKDKYENVIFIPQMRPRIDKRFFLMIYYYSVARMCFYSHAFIGIPGNKKQIRFFMTHASVPLKDTRNKFWSCKRNTYILSTSEFSAFYRSLTFGGGIERFKIFGFPRNDKLFTGFSEAKSKLQLDKYEKIIIWMPTFKHHKEDGRNDFNGKTNRDISLLTDENMRIINDVLEKNGTGLVIKYHPAQNMNYVSCVKLSNVVTVSNEELLAKDISLYSLVGGCDGLITDFSSIYFDYLLVDKPIAFELGDKAEYESGVGFLFDRPLDYMPGHKIYSVTDLVTFISDVANSFDPYSEERRLLCHKVHNYTDDKASKRIVDFLHLGE